MTENIENHQLRPTIPAPPHRTHMPPDHADDPHRFAPLPAEAPAASQSEVIADMVAEAVASAMIANKSQSVTPDTVRRAAHAGAMKAIQ